MLFGFVVLGIETRAFTESYIPTFFIVYLIQGFTKLLIASTSQSAKIASMHHHIWFSFTFYIFKTNLISI